MDVTARFIEYCKFYTTSDETSETVPSTARQLDLARYIVSELQNMGVEAEVDEMGYVYAFLPASEDRKDCPALGFIAHMDTSPDAPGENVQPLIREINGEPCVCTDRSTLLGADDKAGVAEIVTAVEYYVNHKEASHNAMAIAFTPDEEIGRGADHFDLEKFKAKVAYTVDGGALGEIEAENFNAASASVTIHGYNVHPGDSYGKMKNAVLIATEFISRLPKNETPATTRDYEGFYHVAALEGDETEAKFFMLIREFDWERFRERKNYVNQLAKDIAEEFQVEIDAVVKDSYYNMKEKIVPEHQYLIDLACDAMRACGAEPKVQPIRGGTDGARLSFEGLPCPNLSTGGVEFHSVDEYVPVHSLETMVEVVKYLAAAQVK